MKRALIVVAVLALVAAAFWAGRVTLTPPEIAAPVSDSEVLVEVTEREVGRVLTLTTSVTRSSTPLAVNRLAGTVTAVAPGGELNAGDALYAVDGVPVRVVAGAVPFHRALGEGDSGPDAAQLQETLIAAGLLSTSADGKWGAATTRALKAWQAAGGQPKTGVMGLGELIAVPSLPAPITPATDVLWLGAALSGGEVVARTVSGDPVFAMVVSQQQAQLIAPGTSVQVTHAERAWSGIVGEGKATEAGVSIPVTAPDGGLLCGADCADLPATGNLMTQVQIVAPERGPVVPVAAVTTSADGTTSVRVVTAAGEESRPVTVRAVADGLAVVDGVAAGEQVRVFGAAPEASES